MKRPHSISHAQYIIMLLSVPLDAAVLHYTVFVYRVGAMGWLATIVAGVALSLILMWPVARLMDRFPGETIVGIARSLYGRPLGALLTLPVLLFGGAFTCLFLMRGLTELFARTLLSKTPEIVILAVILFVVAYIASLGTEGIARLGEIAVYLITLPLVAPIFAIALSTVQFEFLQPVMWWPKGLLTSPDFYASLSFFSGAASLTVFAPFLRPTGRSYRPVLWAGCGAFALLVIATIIPLGILGPETATQLSLPVIFALNTMHTTVLFIQQLSYLTVALMSVFCFVAGAMTLWMTARGLTELTGLGSDLIWSWITAAAVFGLGVGVISQAVHSHAFQIWSLSVGALYVWIILVFALPSRLMRSRPRAEDRRG